MVGKAQALDYTGPSLGNQVDGLPSARHNREFLSLMSNTKAVWRPHGVSGPAPIHAPDPWQLKIEDQTDSTVPERFVQVQVCIVMLLLRYLESKISCQTLNLNGMQNL